MALADLDLPVTFLADAERFRDDLVMSEDILMDHILMNYAPDDEGEGYKACMRNGVIRFVEHWRAMGRLETD